MANHGPKKRLEENRKKLQALKLAIAIGILVYIAIRLVLRQGYTSKWHIIGLGATFFLELFSYSAIAKFAEPEFDENGDVVYGGADLSMKGMCGYWHDILYVTIFTQVAVCLSTYFWYTFLVVPGYALYMLGKHVLVPYWNSGSREETTLDEATRKKLERTQQRAERRRMKWR